MKFFPKIKNRGMTLVELIVVLSIFMMVTGIVLFDYKSFRSYMTTQNLADDIALSIRRVQSYAIGTKGSGGYFDKPYGIHFSTTNITAYTNTFSTPKSFVIFVDNNGDNKYTLGTDVGISCEDHVECMEKLTISTTDQIKGFYVNGTIQQVGGSNISDSLDILFKRPNPDASFCYKPNINNDSCSNTNISKAGILVGPIGVTGKDKIIEVQNTGQISIKNASA